MLSFLLPAVVLRAMTRGAFRLSRRVAKAAAIAERREAAAGGYYAHPALVGVVFVVCLLLTALAEGA